MPIKRSLSSDAGELFGLPLLPLRLFSSFLIRSSVSMRSRPVQSLHVTEHEVHSGPFDWRLREEGLRR